MRRRQRAMSPDVQRNRRTIDGAYFGGHIIRARASSDPTLGKCAPIERSTTRLVERSNVRLRLGVGSAHSSVSQVCWSRRGGHEKKTLVCPLALARPLPQQVRMSPTARTHARTHVSLQRRTVAMGYTGCEPRPDDAARTSTDRRLRSNRAFAVVLMSARSNERFKREPHPIYMPPPPRLPSPTERGLRSLSAQRQSPLVDGPSGCRRAGRCDRLNGRVQGPGLQSARAIARRRAPT